MIKSKYMAFYCMCQLTIVGPSNSFLLQKGKKNNDIISNYLLLIRHRRCHCRAVGANSSLFASLSHIPRLSLMIKKRLALFLTEA